jgi:Zn-dependent protease
MFSWSINLFRIRGIQLAVHGSFLLLLAYVAFKAWPEGGWPGLVLNVGMVVLFFVCVVLHELGHSLTAMHFGIGVRRILLMPIGGMAEFDAIPREPGRELLITLAGPAVNFVIAGGLFALVGLPEGWRPFGFYDFPDSPLGLAQLLLHWNLLMGCFNLLTIFPMDGGRILRALLASRLPYLQATRWASTVGKVLAVIGGLVSALLFHNYLTAFLFVFIYAAGDAEYRAVYRRELEEAHWREMGGRYAEPPPLAEEPPVIGP